MSPNVTAAGSIPPRAGSYVRIRELAKGGMGRVDLVLRREGQFERLYALKRMHAVWQDDPGLRAMFLDEARIAGLIRHPNVVSVLDVGEDEEGPYLVMDYVDGVSVVSIIAQAKKADALIPVAFCLEVVRQAAEGLHAAHELVGHDGAPLELVHRDVSPQNILVGFDAVARVTDFGIAKAFGRTTRTSTGLLKGKMGYMAPEQLRFEHPDRRSDLFSLGVVLYEMLAADRLYQDDDAMTTAQRILQEPPPDIGEVREDVPMDVVALLFELLAKDREARPKDAETVARRLAQVLAVMALEQGPPLVGEWLEDRFGEWRRAQRDEVSRGLAAARAGLYSQTPALVPAVEPAGPPASTTGFVRSIRRRPMPWIAGIAAAAIGATAGVLAWGAIGGAGDAASPPSVASEAPRVSPIPPEPVAGPAAEPEIAAVDPEADVGAADPEPIEAAEAPAEGSPEIAAGTEGADPAIRPAAREKRRRAVRRNRRRARPEETPIWRWE